MAEETLRDTISAAFDKVESGAPDTPSTAPPASPAIAPPATESPESLPAVAVPDASTQDFQRDRGDGRDAQGRFVSQKSAPVSIR